MSYQKTIICGYSGRDAEIKHLSDGEPIASFSVAVTEKRKDSTGAIKESAEWFRCTAYGKLGEIAGQYVKKGSLVLVSAKRKTRTWQDKTGQEKSAEEYRVDELKLLGKPPSASADAPTRKTQEKAGSIADMDDDVPF